MFKKKNPTVQLKQSDINKLKKDATNIGIKYATILFFTVMRDKEGYGVKRLKRIYDATGELADSVSKGYVNFKELENTLFLEANIKIE